MVENKRVFESRKFFLYFPLFFLLSFLLLFFLYTPVKALECEEGYEPVSIEGLAGGEICMPIEDTDGTAEEESGSMINEPCSEEGACEGGYKCVSKLGVLTWQLDSSCGYTIPEEEEEEHQSGLCNMGQEGMCNDSGQRCISAGTGVWTWVNDSTCPTDSDDDGGYTPGGTDDHSTPPTIEGIFGPIDTVFDILIPVGVLLALLFVIIGGYMWMTAAGNPDKIKQAQGTLTWAIIGLIFISIVGLLFFALVDYIEGM